MSNDQSEEGGMGALEGEDGPTTSASNVVRLPLRDQDAELELELAEIESIEALKEALEDLRGEIRSRLVEREGVSPGSTEFFALFDEFRQRLANAGIRERAGEVDDFGLDADALAGIESLTDFLIDRYWRVEVHGLETVPRDSACLFVANRSGLLPYDGLVLARLLERAGFSRPRFLVADWLITLPFAQPALARWGGLRACRENTDALLRTDRSVIAFPEGEKGAAKVFRQRYRLQRFGRGGAVRAAIENGVPLVPVGIVGAEEAHPVLFKSRLPARLLGLPFLPVTPTFPWTGPLGLLPLPTKWVIRFGEPVDLGGHSDAGPAGNDPLLVSRLNETLRDRVQTLVDEGLEQRGSVWG
jgi:1-acyl-sn-glycerol-3-phosphate acyltransferase